MPQRERVALVTGGSRGIGLGIAQALAGEGWRLVLNGVRSEAEVLPRLAFLREAEVSFVYVSADVGVAGDRARLIERTREEYGRLDLLVNNAGVAPAERADLLEAGEESFERLVRINAQGPYFLTQLAARWMIEQVRADRGRCPLIVNISSVSAEVPSTNRGDYCMSKAALSMSTQLWAARLAEHRIAVFEIRPGLIETDMTAGAKEKYDALIQGGATLHPRWGTPADIGRAVAMLARGDLPYATGHVLTLDGGLTRPRL